MIRLHHVTIDSPLGTLDVVGGPDGLCVVRFGRLSEGDRALLRSRFGEVSFEESEVVGAGAITAYFDGDLEAINALAVDAGGTPFQRQVWRELRRISAGTTVTYGDIARSLNQPTASRAIGSANHLNPVAIVVPCHRVVGADRSLTGYAAGIERKRWLLEHEGAWLPLFGTPPQRAASPRATL